MSSKNQNKHQPLELSKNREEFLERAFAANDGCLSVGGLAHRLGLLPGQEDRDALIFAAGKDADTIARRVALSKFVEFSRRLRGMTVETFATKAGVDAAEVLQVEDEDAKSPEPRVIHSIATLLRVDANKLMELAGHIHLRDENLGKEAVRFAASSHGSEPLSKEQEQFLAIFAKVVVETTDRR